MAFRVFSSVCIFIIFISSLALPSEKQVEVTNFLAKLYLAPSINSKFMGLAQKGERYKILLVSNYWYRIDFKGVPVWVESSNIQVIDPDAPPLQNDSDNTPDRVIENIENTVKEHSITPTVNTTGNPDNQPTSTSVDQNLNEPNSESYNNTSSPKKTNTSKEIDSVSQKSKLQRWISRQSLSRLPVIEQTFEEKKNNKIFLVTSSPAKILLTLSPDSPILGMAKRGERLSLVAEGDSWCRVAYKDTVGWIEKKIGKIIDSEASSFFSNAPVVIILIGSVLLLLLLIIITVKLIGKRSSSKLVTSAKKQAVIIAREPKLINEALTDNAITIDKCFTEIGFEVKYASDLLNVKTIIDTRTPDVILIDWRFDRTIFTTIEKFFVSSPKAETVIIIVYNVPDPSSMFTSSILPKMAFFGITFSDRDLFKVVTPLMLSTGNAEMQKSIQSSALEGEIAGGNLIEVLQYIEAGQKNGCLLIDTGKPFCMIYFNSGRIIYAATSEGLTGREAVFSVLNLKEGKFRFLLNKKPNSSNTDLSTLEVLMSWTKNIDETLRN